MPAESDRVSVGSPGGAGGNEIEAVAIALHPEWPEIWPPYGHYRAEIDAECERVGEVIAALDAARRSPQGEEHEADEYRLWVCDNCGHWHGASYNTWDPDRPPRCKIKGYGQDGKSSCGHVMRLVVTRVFPSPVSGADHEAPPPGKFVSIAANKAMAAPVSGTEGEDHEALIARLRDGIEHKNQRIVALNRRIYELEHPLLASPVSGTEPDTAKLRDALALLRGYVPMGGGAWGIINEALAGFSIDAGKAEGSSGYEQIGDINWPPRSGGRS